MSRHYLDDFMLHDGVQPLDEGLHCGVLPQQLLQLLKHADGVVWKIKEETSGKANLYFKNLIVIF